MSSPEARAQIAQTLSRLASTPGASDFFALGRVQRAGEPTGWRDEITFERGQLQTYSRTRSAADQGGAAIGVWRAPAEDWRTQALADALSRARAWNLESDPAGEPGVEMVNWSCITSHGVLELSALPGSALLDALMPVDVELRHLANTLTEQRAGAQMRTALRVQTQGNSAALTLAFGNDGMRRFVLANPLRFPAGGADYFRVEVAPMPRERPGETGYGAAFKPVPLRLPPTETLKQPWSEEYFVIGPGERIVVPAAPVIGPLQPGSYIVRAAYSNYGLLAGIAGVPVIRGRSFSNEVVVKL